MKRLIVSLLTSLGLLVAVASSGWSTTYVFTTIDVPGADFLTNVLGINSAGDIVGDYQDATGVHGFLYDGVSFTTIDVPGASETHAYGIDNTERIVGYFINIFGPHGFVYDTGTYTPFDVPGSPYTFAFGINDLGLIVGNASGGGFLYNGSTATVINVPGAAFTNVFRINDSAQIVGDFGDALGTHGFLLSGGSFNTIDVPGAAATLVQGINNQGLVVGVYRDAGLTFHGFVYDGATFNTLDVPATSGTSAQDINDSGYIVGTFQDSKGGHGFLATPLSADLAIRKSAAPDPVTLGNTVTYIIMVTNNGPTAATNVSLIDSLPAGLAFGAAIASQGHCGFITATSTVTCLLDGLSMGASATVTITVKAMTVETIINSAQASATEPDPNPSNNTASVKVTVVPAADLAVFMTDSPDPVKKGAKLTYAITVTNGGPNDATGVTLTDALPSHIILEKIHSTQGSCTGISIVSCVLGTLPVGASATVQIVIKPMDTGTITNTATVSGVEADPNSANNTASVDTLVKK